MRKRNWLLATIIVVLPVTVSLVACERVVNSPKSFSLPEGDVELGQLVYSQYGCAECHTLFGVEDTGGGIEAVEQRTISVELGGTSTRVTTYAELVTSIINPSHKLATGYEKTMIAEGDQSKMRNYNDVMTVTDLVHLVTYLHSHYQLEDIPVTVYPRYVP